jgi:hypothetical protein
MPEFLSVSQSYVICARTMFKFPEYKQYICLNIPYLRLDIYYLWQTSTNYWYYPEICSY